MNEYEERWRPVVGWEGFYEVSNFGRVRSLARRGRFRDGEALREGRILKAMVCNAGYPRIQLCDGDRQVQAHVHRLVADAFVPGTGDVVRHLDGNPQNNFETNLAFGTFADNEADKARHGRVPRGETHARSVLTDSLVRSIRDLHKRGFSQLKIAAALKLNRGVIGCVVRGETWTHVQ